MDINLVAALGKTGAVASMSIAAIGSALGTGAAGMAAVGAWKKCYIQKKRAPFQLAVFAGAPLSQTIYGLILMLVMQGKIKEIVDNGVAADANWLFYLLAGILGGTAMGVSAWMQGKAAAGACDSFAETGEGFTNNLMILGIIETAALFVMVFILALAL
ncbi:MAG: V-type ATP synthase subunit K [Verrucomicrobiota bacterium]|nr:V-type ATP synthase subunit K [Verrucomicrobiota bacterium]